MCAHTHTYFTRVRSEGLTQYPGWINSNPRNSNLLFMAENHPSCCCCVSVMILGVTILRKKYPLAKYLCVLLIVSGVALFLYKPNRSSAVADDHVFGFGEILLVSQYS